MKRSISMVALALLLAAPAFGADEGTAVGKVSILEGSGARFAGAAGNPDSIAGKPGTPLKVGDAVLLGDVITLEKGNLKLVLNDQSEIALGSDTGKGNQSGAKLAITEGDFKDQVRSSFGAKLFFGKVWSHVTKALSGSDAKFEVTTPRAVAGVRGTIFRVDAVSFVTASKAKKEKTIVRVAEGKVAVEARVKVAMADKPPPDKGPRHEVSGPQEISKDEWEKKFVELQKGMQVEVGEELWKESKAPTGKDDFDRFVDKNP